MSLFTDYTPDEQQLLLRSLQAAAVAVAAASLGRKTETVSEGVAAASFIMARTATTVSNPLISAVQYALEQRAARGEPFPNFEKAANAPGAAEAALATLRELADLLAAQTDADAARGFKEWLLAIARSTAEAGKEGGNFWGRGAVQVNAAEEAALEAVAAVLGVT